MKRPIFRPRSLSYGLLLSLLGTGALACGPGGGNTDGGPGTVTDAAYFGLELGRCFVFKGGLGGVESMTLGVEAENDALGFKAGQLRYRLGGFVRRTDYITIEAGQVLIHQRSVVGQPNQDVEFSPPIAWLARPFAPTGTSPLRTDTSATDVFSGVQESWTARTTVQPTESVTVPYLSAAAEAYPTFVVYDRTDATGAMRSEQDIFHFLPETGFVKADLNADTWPAVELVSTHMMPQGETTCTTGP